MVDHTASAGLHHVTAITGDARRNLAFYAEGLGLQLVKKTVNFDDPNTYHLYYGDAVGSPGTILTFFPWAHAAAGRPGVGEAAETSFAVQPAALADWRRRLRESGLALRPEVERFGEAVLPFSDAEGQRLEIIGREGADAGDRLAALAGVTLQVAQAEPTIAVLEHALGWRSAGEDGAVLRVVSPDGRQHVDLVATETGERARLGRGSVHHVAFRAESDAHQAELASRVEALGLPVTEQKDRQYFRSVYFREPGGVIFEIATDDPGFTADEAPEALGTRLMLPAWLEPRRASIEAQLPPLAQRA